MHRHEWSNWAHEMREHKFETDDSCLTDQVAYNIRFCKKCGLLQEKRASDR